MECHAEHHKFPKFPIDQFHNHSNLSQGECFQVSLTFTRLLDIAWCHFYPNYTTSNEVHLIFWDLLNFRGCYKGFFEKENLDEVLRMLSYASWINYLKEVFGALHLVFYLYLDWVLI